MFKCKMCALFWGLLISAGAIAQEKEENIDQAYVLAKKYYENKDFLKAYKYLLTYKYSRLDSLKNAPDKSRLQSINQAIAFCEKKLTEKSAALSPAPLTGNSSTRNVRGFGKSLKTNVNEGIKIQSENREQ